MATKWPGWILVLIPLFVFFLLRPYSLIAGLVGFVLSYVLVLLAWFLTCKRLRGSFFIRALWPALPVLLIYLWIWLLKKLPLSQGTILFYSLSSNVLTMFIIGIVALVVYAGLSRKLVCPPREEEKAVPNQP